MFVAENGRGYRGTEQIAWGWFLIVFTAPTEERLDGTLTSAAELRAAVRYAHLAQCGHFMMGSVRVGAHRIVLSGTYGGDGLPCDCPTLDLWERLYKVPPFLQRLFWSGGGHNTGGHEMPALHQWAGEHLHELRASGTKDAARVLARYRHARR